ncbi:Thiamine-monophosphate kinase [Buchnera aphidicola (Neophyllaphis podocarpi)]|uniref:thiamine-phosphate kinase n=1 Tax=Buchnera aphidicola TaxID=9 RepID=UPI003464431B
MLYNEFKIIKQFFNKKQKKTKNLIKGIGDDSALINIPSKYNLAISTDTLVEGVHFLKNIKPQDLGYKVLAVNLSDMAAMGAVPKWITIAITIPKINSYWLKNFTKGLFLLLNKYNMKLIGGDTTKGNLSINISIYGMVPKNNALLRNGANKGDLIYVTGTLGDSAAGLFLLKQNNKKKYKKNKELIKRHLNPIPRIEHGLALRNIASSAIDISDGLIKDLSHILKSSKCGANVYLESLPISKMLRNNFKEKKWLNWALSAGEDYEICFTVPKKNKTKLDIALYNLKVPYTCIGKINKSCKIKLFYQKKEIYIKYKGFDHFQKK